MENKCKEKDDNFLYCKETLDGIKCATCDDYFYFAEDGKCSPVNFCAKVENNKCVSCKQNYFLSSHYGYSQCTITPHCASGDADTGLCLTCEDDYYIDYKDGKCKYFLWKIIIMIF